MASGADNNEAEILPYVDFHIDLYHDQRQQGRSDFHPWRRLAIVTIVPISLRIISEKLILHDRQNRPSLL